MILYDAQRHIFHLQTEEFSYVMQILEDGQLIHRYFGQRVNHFGDHPLVLLNRSFSPNPTASDRTYSLDTQLLEYSTNGLGDFRESAIAASYEDGSSLDLRYRQHRIYKGKKALAGLPSSYGDDDQVESLEIDLYDDYLDLTVTLFYSLFPETNMLAKSVKVRAGQRAVCLEKVLSLSLDLPDSAYQVHTLNGRYAQEKLWTISELRQGKFSIESRRGASGHAQTPFIALADEQVTEDSGQVYSAHLIYSGNFVAFAEVNQLEMTRLGIGISDYHFRWRLEAGEEFQTPEALLSYTNRGFSGMTQTSHHFIRQHILSGKYKEKTRPILVNNWEATYFQFTEQKILELAEVASQAGIEMLVLDDGWFGHRDDDNSSLGDWFLYQTKLPNGLAHLAQKVNEKGLDFGLWFEPEMISEDSDLYRQHPDWAIQMAGRSHRFGREQLVLDLTKPEVCDYIVKSVTAVLESANISYVKWDMNRNITNPSDDLANDVKQEFYHRYMLGLYDILERLTKAFPEVLFESCSGGGGRYDLGMLCYMPQTWTSDNTDAISRLSIQEGTSLIYPTLTMGAHVSAVPNHQVGRLTPLETRGHVAMMGNLGYELDLTKLSTQDLSGIKEQVKTYKTIRDTIQLGDFYRLSTKSENEKAYCQVSSDRDQAVLTYVKILAQPESPISRIKLKGLDPDACYDCDLLGRSYYGDELMCIGLDMPLIQQDYQSVQYLFNKKRGENL
ncbi:alpha-galactosidase [Streptococcus merionis]|uniref:alpha-galactosidase n=1 Tax=Streptococcus merionis TaxID=400065 RepID=UPI00351591DE